MTHEPQCAAKTTATYRPNKLVWQWSDLNNTGGWQVDAATTGTPVVRRTDPFGGVRGAGASGWAGDRGMADGIVDAVTGTLRLGARDYDPATGRFTQPDPLIASGDPVQWNAYAYGANIHRYGVTQKIDGWELTFDEARNPGQNPALIHARHTWDR